MYIYYDCCHILKQCKKIPEIKKKAITKTSSSYNAHTHTLSTALLRFATAQ